MILNNRCLKLSLLALITILSYNFINASKAHNHLANHSEIWWSDWRKTHPAKNIHHKHRSLTSINYNELSATEKAKFKKWQSERKEAWLEWQKNHPMRYHGHGPVAFPKNIDRLNLKQLGEFNKWKNEMNAQRSKFISKHPHLSAITK